MSVPICPHCGKSAKAVLGSAIYPHRDDLRFKWFWRCAPCDAYVGCHAGTKTPLGTLANAATRAARQRAHAAFDPLWKDKRMSRSDAYALMQRLLGLKPADAHISRLTAEQCDWLVELLAKEPAE